MSNKLGLALLLIVLFAVGCAAVTLTLRPTIDNTAAALTNHITAPDPLGDVMEVRQQAESGGRTWATVGLTLVGLLVVGAVLGWVYLKPRMDEQRRKLLNAQRRSSQPQRPLSRVLPPASLSDLPQLPRLNGVQPAQQVEDAYWNE
jgi:hypothetical protein